MKLLSIPVVLLAHTLLASLSLGAAIPRNSIDTAQPHIRDTIDQFTTHVATGEPQEEDAVDLKILGQLSARDLNTEANTELERTIVARANRKGPQPAPKSAFDPWSTGGEIGQRKGKSLGTGVGKIAANADFNGRQAIGQGRDAVVGLGRSTSQRAKQTTNSAINSIQRGGASAVNGLQRAATWSGNKANSGVDAVVGTAQAANHGVQNGLDAAKHFGSGFKQTVGPSFQQERNRLQNLRNNPYPASGGIHGQGSFRPLVPPRPLNERPFHPGAFRPNQRLPGSAAELSGSGGPVPPGVAELSGSGGPAPPGVAELPGSFVPGPPRGGPAQLGTNGPKPELQGGNFFK